MSILDKSRVDEAYKIIEDAGFSYIEGFFLLNKDLSPVVSADEEVKESGSKIVADLRNWSS